MSSRYAALSVSLLVLAAFASGASAAGKKMDTSKDLVVTGEGETPITVLATVYATGFEAASGFALGPIEPQNGYVASQVNDPWASVAAANPYEGSQHLRLIFDVLAGLGTQHVVLGPNIVHPANSPSQVKMQVNISNDGGSDYDVVGQAPSQGFLSWRVKFRYADATNTGPGTIYILDNLGAGLVFVNTGVTYDPGVYRELKVQFDPAASEIRYFYDGNLIYTGLVIFAGTSVDQLVWVTDNFQLTGDESGDFDAIDWIDSASDPVPATNQSWGGVKNLYR